MNKEIYSIFRFFIVGIIVLCICLALYMWISIPSVTTLDIVKFNTLTTGRWDSTYPLFVYYPETVIHILEDDLGNKSIQATFDDLKDYYGFGLYLNQPVPLEASLVVEIHSTNRLATLQIDISDGSPLPSDKTDGEHFSVYVALEADSWETLTIPLEQFQRNVYQSQSLPYDGILDTNPIRRVEFVFTPGTTTVFTIRKAVFTWHNTKDYKIIALLGCSFVGLIVFLISYRKRVSLKSDTLFFSHAVSINSIFVLVGSSLLFSFLFNYEDWLTWEGMFFLSSLLFFLIYDGFFSARYRDSSLGMFRYSFLFVLGNLVNLPLSPIAFFLFFLVTFIPVIQQRSRSLLLMVFIMGIVGLSLNSQASDVQTYLYFGFLVVVATILAYFVHSVFIHYSLSERMGYLKFMYEELFENTADAIYMVDENRVIQNVNSGFEKLTGTSRGQVIQRRLVDFIHEDDRTNLPLEGDYRQKSNIKYELRFIDRSGNIRFTSVNECMIKRGNEIAGFQAIAHDITLLKEYEKSIHEAKEIAENTSRSKSHFLANMSHELRTPLNSIIGFSNILRKNKNDNLSAKELVYVDKVYSSSLFLLKLIDNILDLSKIEAGKMELISESVSLFDLIIEIVNQFEFQTRKKNIQWKVYCPQFKYAFEFDRGKLTQVINNLIGNAIKFTHQGEIAVNVHEQESDHTHSTVLFQIIDSGIGIEKEKQKIIFDSFTQADGSTSRQYAGTGLGLSISKRLIELMGGEIGVESEIGSGSIFWFVLPLKKGNLL